MTANESCVAESTSQVEFLVEAVVLIDGSGVGRRVYLGGFFRKFSISVGKLCDTASLPALGKKDG